jgi:hypothetical protein
VTNLGSGLGGSVSKLGKGDVVGGVGSALGGVTSGVGGLLSGVTGYGNKTDEAPKEGQFF